MHLGTILIYFILLFGENIQMILFQNDFRLFVENVATIFHSDWRKNYLIQHPNTKHRFRKTDHGKFYNQSDFIYPMIINIYNTYTPCLVHRNFKIAQNRWNSSIIYVDILNMNYNELPKDYAENNRITARIACRNILKNLRHNNSFNQYLVDQISERIHIAWIKRNSHTNDKHLLVRYEYLSEIEKNKDRKGVFIACRVFNEQFFFKRFNTTPVYFVQPIEILY